MLLDPVYPRFSAAFLSSSSSYIAQTEKIINDIIKNYNMKKLLLTDADDKFHYFIAKHKSTDYHQHTVI